VLILRSGSFFSPHDTKSFAVQLLRELQDGRRPAAATDVLISPVYVPDLADAALDLLIDAEAGIWHVTNTGALTWLELARELATAANCDGDRVVEKSASEIWKAPRPPAIELGSDRGPQLSEIRSAVQRFVNDTRLVELHDLPNPNAGQRDPVLTNSP
jgi:dTDP-4-dehydrorhamnose reductase